MSRSLHAARSKRAVFGFAVVGVALVTGVTPATASHSFYQRLSAGAVNGNGADGADFKDASSDGKRVFFETGEQLVAGDTNSSLDVYLRAGGKTTWIAGGTIGATFAGASSDGKRLFFETSESLVAGDTDASHDLYERSGGTIKRVSMGAVNGNGAHNALFAGTSSDGTRVFFQTSEQLVAGDTDTEFDIYERAAGVTRRISAGAINGNGAFSAQFQSASNDGTRVLFATDEQLVAGDTDSAGDIYERSGGVTTRVSAGAVNGNSPDNANFKGSSSDGTKVFFETDEQLVVGDTDSEDDVYERSGGVTRRISRGAVNGNGAFEASFEGASSDGTKVLFDTEEQLLTNDTDAQDDLYERSGGVTRRISRGAVNGNGAFSSFHVGGSSDGTRVFFSTDEQLVAADTDTSHDIYERAGGTTTQVSVGVVSGNGAFSSSFRGTSSDGTRVLFQSAEQLVAADTDAETDIYERFAGQTTLLTPGNGSFGANFEGMSDDGSAVFYITDEKITVDDEDSATDIYGAYRAP